MILHPPPQRISSSVGVGAAAPGSGFRAVQRLAGFPDTATHQLPAPSARPLLPGRAAKLERASLGVAERRPDRAVATPHVPASLPGVSVSEAIGPGASGVLDSDASAGHAGAFARLEGLGPQFAVGSTPVRGGFGASWWRVRATPLDFAHSSRPLRGHLEASSRAVRSGFAIASTGDRRGPRSAVH